MSEKLDVSNMEIADDDRLFAALAYALSPIFPLIILFLQDKRDRPFIRAHNVQALIVGLSIWIVIVPATLGCGTIAHILMLFFAFRAYQGGLIEIPIISSFVRSQAWG